MLILNDMSMECDKPIAYSVILSGCGVIIPWTISWSMAAYPIGAIDSSLDLQAHELNYIYTYV